MPNIEPCVQLPKNWNKLSADQKMDKIMLVGLHNNERSKNISNLLGTMTAAINNHTTTRHVQVEQISKFSQGLDSATAEIKDFKLASTSRAPSSNLYLSGLLSLSS